MPPPAHVHAAAVRLARRLAADGPAAPRRTLVVGVPGMRALATLEAALGTADVAADPTTPARPDGAYDVVVALDWLHRLADPAAGLAQLRRLAPALLVAAPREPLAAVGVSGVGWLADRVGGSSPVAPAGASWSGPGFLRFASTAGAVRDVAHPLGWTVVWLRAA